MSDEEMPLIPSDNPSSPALLPSERGEGRKPPLPARWERGLGVRADVGVRATLSSRSRT
jgi:hypothetical protein